MSRTQKRSKAAGYEYWSRRPGNSGGQAPGAASKKHTHRRERRAGKQEAMKDAIQNSNQD